MTLQPGDIWNRFRNWLCTLFGFESSSKILANGSEEFVKDIRMLDLDLEDMRNNPRRSLFWRYTIVTDKFWRYTIVTDKSQARVWLPSISYSAISLFRSEFPSAIIVSSLSWVENFDSGSYGRRVMIICEVRYKLVDAAH